MDANEVTGLSHLIIDGIGARVLVLGSAMTLLCLCASCSCACRCARRRGQNVRHCVARESSARDASELDVLNEDEAPPDPPRDHQQSHALVLYTVVVTLAACALAWLSHLPPFAPWSACSQASTVSLDVALSVAPVAQFVAHGYRWVYARLPKVNGNTLVDKFPPTPGADAYEVQVAYAADSSALPFMSQICAIGATCTIHDLEPSTAYVLKLRQRIGGYWTAQSTGQVCRTLALADLQPRILPPDREPSSDAVSVTLVLEARGRLSPASGHVALEYRRAADGSQGEAPATWHRRTLLAISSAEENAGKGGGQWTKLRLLLGGLAAGNVYEVRAAALYLGSDLGSEEVLGPMSDPVRHATASSEVEPLEVYRLSEMCDLDPSISLRDFSRLDAGPRIFSRCQPEQLTNMNAASLHASAALLGRWAAGAANSSHVEEMSRRFVPSFRHSVVTRSCILRWRSVPFAEYVGCNGVDTQHYVCGPCFNLIDRCIGRLELSGCMTTEPYACRCSTSASAAAARYIGKLSISFPNLLTIAPRRTIDVRSGGFLSQFMEARMAREDVLRCNELLAIANASAFKSAASEPSAISISMSTSDSSADTSSDSSSLDSAAWYSMPAGGECRLAERPGAAPSAIWAGVHGMSHESGCTWSSEAAQRVVHGARLIELGLAADPTGTRDVTAADIIQNSKVLLASFAEHPGNERCCGC